MDVWDYRRITVFSSLKVVTVLRGVDVENVLGDLLSKDQIHDFRIRTRRRAGAVRRGFWNVILKNNLKIFWKMPISFIFKKKLFFAKVLYMINKICSCLKKSKITRIKNIVVDPGLEHFGGGLVVSREIRAGWPRFVRGWGGCSLE